VTLEEAKLAVGQAETEHQRCTQDLAAARAALAGLRERAGADGPAEVRDARGRMVPLAVLIREAEDNLARAEIPERRARESLDSAQLRLRYVSSHAAAFAKLADLTRRLAAKDAALSAIGLDVRKRLGVELADLHKLLQEADVAFAAIPSDVRLALQLSLPAGSAPVWAAVAPGRDDVVACLARATWRITGGP
jgi:hypothetical protein